MAIISEYKGYAPDGTKIHTQTIELDTPVDAQAEHYIRKPLLDFAYEMEDKLRKNDHRSGWKTLPVAALFKLLMLEIEEFRVAHEFFGPDEAAKELVDVANFAMMLADRLKHDK